MLVFSDRLPSQTFCYYIMNYKRVWNCSYLTISVFQHIEAVQHEADEFDGLNCHVFFLVVYHLYYSVFKPGTQSDQVNCNVNLLFVFVSLHSDQFIKLTLTICQQQILVITAIVPHKFVIWSVITWLRELHARQACSTCTRHEVIIF